MATPSPGTPSVGQVQLDLLLQSQSFQTQLTQAVNQAVAQTSRQTSRNLMNTFAGLGKLALGAFSVGALVKFAKESIALGSTLAEVQNVVDSTFTTMSDEANEWAANAIKNFGLSESVAKKYMGTFGAMAKSYGYAEAEALQMSENITGLVGDVASFYNLSSDVAYTKLKSIFTGETESIKDLGIVMTKTALDQYALQKGFGKTTAKMTEQEKVALRYQFVAEKLQTATGDFVRTQDSWANQTRILSLQWDSFKANIGQGLINILTPVLKLMNELIDRAMVLSVKFKELTENLFGDAGPANAQDTADAMGQMAENTEDVGSAAAAAAKKMKGLMGFDQLNILGSKSDATAATTASTAAPAAITPGTAAKTAKETKGIKDKLEDLKKALRDFVDEHAILKVLEKQIKDYCKNLITEFQILWKAIKELGGRIISDVVQLVTKPLADNKEKIAQFLDDILTLYNDAYAKANEILDEIVNDVIQLYDEHIKPIIDHMTELISDLISTILDGWNTYVKPVLDLIMERSDKLLEETIKPMCKDIMDIIGDVIDVLMYLWEKTIEPLMKLLAKALGPTLAAILAIAYGAFETCVKIIGLIIKGLKEMIHGVVDFIEGVFEGDWERAWTGIKEIFKGTIDSILGIFGLTTDDIKRIWENVTTWLSTTADNIKAKFVGAFNGIKDGVTQALQNLSIMVKTPINAIIRAINNMISGINRISIRVPDWAPGIGGASMGFNIPQIPYLADGGYVRANTPRLAVVGDNKRYGEIITPEDKMAEIVGTQMTPVIYAIQQLTSILSRQGSQAGDITIPIYLDGRVLDTYILTAQGRAALRSGGRA